MTYREVAGEDQLRQPSEQTFWAASAGGSESRDLLWEVGQGDWLIVVMNDDASESVHARLSIGVKTGLLLPIGTALLVVGLPLLAGAGAMVFFATRRRR